MYSVTWPWGQSNVLDPFKQAPAVMWSFTYHLVPLPEPEVSTTAVCGRVEDRMVSDIQKTLCLFPAWLSLWPTVNYEPPSLECASPRKRSFLCFQWIYPIWPRTLAFPSQFSATHPGYSLLPVLQQRKGNTSACHFSVVCGDRRHRRVAGKEDETIGPNKLGDFSDFVLRSNSLDPGAACN